MTEQRRKERKRWTRLFFFFFSRGKRKLVPSSFVYKQRLLPYRINRFFLFPFIKKRKEYLKKKLLFIIKRKVMQRNSSSLEKKRQNVKWTANWMNEWCQDYFFSLVLSRLTRRSICIHLKFSSALTCAYVRHFHFIRAHIVDPNVFMFKEITKVSSFFFSL